MATFRCKQCNSLLPAKRARCEGCGYAVDYNPEVTRRQRQLGFTLIGIAFAIAVVVYFAAAFIDVLD